MEKSTVKAFDTLTLVRVKVNLPLFVAPTVGDSGSFAVSSPVFVVDLTATAGMLLFVTKLGVTVTCRAGMTKVVVAPRMLPVNSETSSVLQTFNAWLVLGGFAVIVTMSPGAASVTTTPLTLAVPLGMLRLYF